MAEGMNVEPPGVDYAVLAALRLPVP